MNARSERSAFAFRLHACVHCCLRAFAFDLLTFPGTPSAAGCRCPSRGCCAGCRRSASSARPLRRVSVRGDVRALDHAAAGDHDRADHRQRQNQAGQFEIDQVIVEQINAELLRRARRNCVGCASLGDVRRRRSEARPRSVPVRASSDARSKITNSSTAISEKPDRSRRGRDRG